METSPTAEKYARLDCDKSLGYTANFTQWDESRQLNSNNQRGLIDDKSKTMMISHQNVMKSQGKSSRCGKIKSNKRVLEKEAIICQVCGDIAAGFYCSAYICEACKKFFIRSTKMNHIQYVCQHQERCEITKENRVQCQYCRYQKCLRLNMSYTEKGKHSKMSGIKEIPCRVCSAPSSGFHFGAITCEGCKGFFRRAVKEKDSINYRCIKQGNCEINFTARTCKACRYKKCLEVGMSVNASRIGRQPNAVKHAISLEAKEQLALRENYKISGKRMSRKHADDDQQETIFRRDSDLCSQQTNWTNSVSENDEYTTEKVTHDEIDEGVRRKKYRLSLNVAHDTDKYWETDIPPRDTKRLPLVSLKSKIHTSSLSSISEKNIVPFMKRPFSHEQYIFFGKGTKSFKSSYNSYVGSYNNKDTMMNGIPNYYYPDQYRYKYNGAENSNAHLEDYNFSLKNPKSNINQPFGKYNIYLSDENGDIKEKGLFHRNVNYMEFHASSHYDNKESANYMKFPASSHNDNIKDSENHMTVVWDGTKSYACNDSGFYCGSRKYIKNTHHDGARHRQRNRNTEVTDDGCILTHKSNSNDMIKSDGAVEYLDLDRYNHLSRNPSLYQRSDSSIGPLLSESDNDHASSTQSNYWFEQSSNCCDFKDDQMYFIPSMLSRAANELTHMCTTERVESGVYDEDSYTTIESTWSRMMKHFEFHAKCVVRFVKRIPGFRDLKVDDQIRLLQRNTYPLVVLNQGRTFDPETGFINYFNFTYKEEKRVHELFPELNCLRSHFLHSGYISLYLKMTDIEYAYLSCLVLLTNDSPEVVNGEIDKVTELREFYTEYFYESEYVKDKVRFGEMLLRISEFSQFSLQHDLAVEQILKKHRQLYIPLLFAEMYQ